MIRNSTIPMTALVWTEQINTTRGTALARVTIDDTFPDNPKIIGLDLSAVGLWTLLLCHARKYDDALVPLGLAKRYGGSQAKRLMGLMVERGLFDPSGTDWRWHDFEDYAPSQTSRERTAKWRARRSGDSHGDVTRDAAVTPPSRTRPPVPVSVVRTEPLAGASGEKPVANAPGSPVEKRPRSLQDHELTLSGTPLQGEIVQTSAAQFVGEYADLREDVGSPSIASDRARVGKDVKQLLAAGKSPEIISAALKLLVERARPPSALVGLVDEIERNRAGHSVSNGRGHQSQVEAIARKWRSEAQG